MRSRVGTSSWGRRWRTAACDASSAARTTAGEPASASASWRRSRKYSSTSEATCVPQLVESKWQERWVRQHTNEPDLDRPRRPFYNLMMFPYPSAEGLHVGNMFAFTGADIYGRFKRLQGHDVFEPIGFDAFGIH